MVAPVGRGATWRGVEERNAVEASGKWPRCEAEGRQLTVIDMQ